MKHPRLIPTRPIVTLAAWAMMALPLSACELGPVSKVLDQAETHRAEFDYWHELDDGMALLELQKFADLVAVADRTLEDQACAPGPAHEDMARFIKRKEAWARRLIPVMARSSIILNGE